MPNESVALRDLALMPGLIAAHASAIISGAHVPAPPVLLEYAQTVRALLKCGWRAVESSTNAPALGQLISLAEEILVTELTCRIVAGVLAMCDARRGRPLAAPFARSALLDLLQAKHSVLSQLVAGPQPLGAFLRVNQLRRKTERWCDCLLGSLPDHRMAEPFAVDADRMRQFLTASTVATSETARYLAVVSLRHSLPRSLVQDEQRCQIHRRLMRTLVGFWPAAAFDSHGLMRGPLWQRLRGLTDAPPLPGQFCAPSVPDELEVIRRRFRSRAALYDDDDEPLRG